MEIQNYTLIEKREIAEYQATGYLYRHNQTGAPVFYLYAPEDDNKVFSISFCTPPANNEGIPHILEHCVLNGSRKFPVKEPFVELLKGSLNTFLNAMTFSDKTMFPVASRNEQDFINLMDVYLDAVLHPNLRHDPFILKQEGWHYELEEQEGDIQYKGVVYNEMKGAYSSPETVLNDTVDKALYPDTIYANSSGGDPDFIPDLTYEEFRAFHETYYHPSNSYIFFYGNGDMEKHLTFLHEAYLQEFEASIVKGEIPEQTAFESIHEVEHVYALADGEDTKGKTFLSYNVVAGHSTDPLNYYGLDMLAQLLGGCESAPIKTALLKAGIGKEVYAAANASMQQPSFSIVAKNADPEQKDEFVRIIRKTLEEIVQNGLDPKLVEATLNSTEFSLRESNFGSMPKGLMLNISCMDSWLYGESPFQLLSYEEPLSRIRNTPRFFEMMIQTHLLQNTHGAIVTLRPQPGLNQKVQQAVQAKLDAYKAGLTPEEVAELVAETKRIQERQQSPDKPEDLQKLPLLERKDIDPKQTQFIAALEDVGGKPAYIYEDFTNHIAYVSLYFNMDYLPEKDLPYAGLLAGVLAMMNTERYTYTELDNEIGCHLGSLNTNITLLEKMDGSFVPYFYLSTKYLIKENQTAFDLAKEILLHTDFSDKSRLKEIVAENRSRMEQSMMQAGHMVAGSRATSYFSPLMAYSEQVTGVDFFLFMKELEQHFDEQADEAIRRMQEVLDILIRQEQISFRITCQKEEKQEILLAAERLAADLPAGKSVHASEQVVRVQPEVKNEGLITSGKVQYVAKAGRFTQPYHGSMVVLGHILYLDYLWSQVRAQGGAYGCFQNIDRQGRIRLVSFRDPNLARTVDVFEKAGPFMETFSCSERELTKYIIGTIAGLDPVRTVSMKGAAACVRLECGITPEYLQQLRDEVLGTTQEQIHESAKALTQAMQEPYICVQGSEEKIKADKDLFKTIITLF
ncbi:MAG: insulinase family protein [Lachnospiraceae bacterium]|jgi:Zn-dependent M16 (insulinase) family peptidase|nr:insulinase family protein [Lachnospiraceae bacterium]